jgi:hypothetical protein
MIRTASPDCSTSRRRRPRSDVTTHGASIAPEVNDLIVGRIPPASRRDLDRQVAPRQLERLGRDGRVEHEDHGIIVRSAPLGDALRETALGRLRVVPPSVGS